MRNNTYLYGLDSVGIDARGILPETPGVYMSTDLRQRWRSHHRLADVSRHAGARIYFIELDPRVYRQVDDVRVLEAYCIRRFQPRYNNTPSANIWRDRFVILYQQYKRMEHSYAVQQSPGDSGPPCGPGGHA